MSCHELFLAEPQLVGQASTEPAGTGQRHRAGRWQRYGDGAGAPGDDRAAGHERAEDSAAGSGEGVEADGGEHAGRGPRDERRLDQQGAADDSERAADRSGPVPLAVRAVRPRRRGR